jgi:hypothetical protein
MTMVGSGVLRANAIYLPDGIGYGYAYASANHVAITHNYIRGGDRGVWTDTGSNTNIVVANNTFDDVHLAYFTTISASGQDCTGLYFVNNTVHNKSADMLWMAVTPPATYTNIVIARNIQIPWNSSHTNWDQVVINVYSGDSNYSVGNLSVFGNIWPTNSSLSWRAAPWFSYDNVDLLGKIHDLPSSLGAAYSHNNAIGALPTLILTSGSWPNSDQLTLWDCYVLVTSMNSNAQLKLPEIAWAGGFNTPGRQIVVANTASSGTVTLVPGSGNSMKANGTNIASLVLTTTSAPAKFVSDSSGTWHKF